MVSAKKVMISIVVACILLFMLFFNTLITFVTDYQWFQEVGYEKVFLTKLFTQLKLGIPIFIILTIVIYFYFLSIKKDYYKKVST
ncbi:MAG TPA: COG1615 family transporter, partial [Clostridiales bacterium]|nr:COG1615 family transporter [Clostridiales bacterium]